MYTPAKISTNIIMTMHIHMVI